MSKKPSKFRHLFTLLGVSNIAQLKKLLASKPPEYWGVSILEKIGRQKQPLLKVIRAQCLECSAHQPKEVRLCQADTCPSWPYRMATNPFRKGRSDNDA